MGKLAEAIIYPHAATYTPRICQKDYETHLLLRGWKTSAVIRHIRAKIMDEGLKRGVTEYEERKKKGLKLSVESFLNSKMANKRVK